MVSFLFLILLLPFGAVAQTCPLKSHSELGREILDELRSRPISCSGQPVHLTFDDGPSPEVTPIILKELALRGLKATFFITTTNLASLNRFSSVNQALVRREMGEGHLVADHGFEHNAYDLRLNGKGEVLERGMSAKEREEQIKRSVKLLNTATKGKFSQQDLLLFRLPYGRGAMPSPQELDYLEQEGKIKFSAADFATRLAEYREQSAPLQLLAGEGFSHLGWNHDSGDSSFGMKMPPREKLKAHVLKNLQALCHSPVPVVALFHDIKVMNTEVLPVLVDVGMCLGLKFVSPAEMMEHQEILRERGVLLGKKAITEAPVKRLENILSTLPQKMSGNAQCEDGEKTCYSADLNRTYQRCQGGDSICLDGKWYSRRDPLIILNCNLTD